MDLLQFLREPLAQLLTLPAFLPKQAGEMNLLALVGGFVGVLMFVPLCISICNRSAKQNIATFALWGALDALAAGSAYAANGNWLLPALYTVGAVAVIGCIILRNPSSITLGWTEGFCAFMALLCVVVWTNWHRQHLIEVPLSTEQIVVVLSAVALTVAGLPQLKDTIVEPKTAAPLTYLGYTVANALSTAAGASWAVEERLYGASATILTTLIVLAGSRRWFLKH